MMSVGFFWGGEGREKRGSNLFTFPTPVFPCFGKG